MPVATGIVLVLKNQQNKNNKVLILKRNLKNGRI